MTITKQQLIQHIVRTYRINRVEAGQFVQSFFEVIIAALESGDNVKIARFGNFSLRHKKARIGRNPKTLQEHAIKARRVVAFRSSNVMKSLLKNQEYTPPTEKLD